MKKAISLLSAFLVIFSSTFLSSTLAAAADEASTAPLKVNVISNYFPSTSAEYDADTSEVTVTCYMQSSKDLLNIQWTLFYDSTVFSISSKNTRNTVIPVCYSSTAVSYHYSAVSTEEMPDENTDRLKACATSTSLFDTSSESAAVCQVKFNVLDSDACVETTLTLRVDVLCVSALDSEGVADSDENVYLVNHAVPDYDGNADTVEVSLDTELSPESNYVAPTTTEATESVETTANNTTEESTTEQSESSTAESTEESTSEQTDPVVTDPTEESTSEQTDPVATDPTEENTTEQSESSTAESTEENTTEQSESSIAESTEENTTEQSESSTAESTEENTSEQTEPVATDPTEESTSEQTDPVATDPTEESTSEQTDPVATDPTEGSTSEQTDPVATDPMEGSTYTDEATDISVTADEGGELSVENLTHSESADEVKSYLDEGENLLELYSIELTDDGAEFELSGNVTVQIPVTNENAVVYKIEADGTVTDMNAVYTDGYLVFTDDSLGLYAIVINSDNLLMGDVNGDGFISVADATLIQKYIVGSYSFTSEQALVAEVNGDGIISITDATALQKMVVGTA